MESVRRLVALLGDELGLNKVEMLLIAFDMVSLKVDLRLEGEGTWSLRGAGMREEV